MTAAPVTTDTADDLRTALAGLAFHELDVDPKFARALRRLLMPGVPERLWEVYREAYDSVDDLRGEADPFRYTDADPKLCSAETARAVALQEWTDQRDEALDALIVHALRAC